MNREVALTIYSTLFQYYDIHSEQRHFLKFENPFQILILTILSAQTTDKAVNEVGKTLFAKYPTPIDLGSAQQAEVEKVIKSLGFYRNKTHNIIKTAELLATKYHNEVPRTMEDLLTFPGVGRKTANIVLNHAFGINEGIAVDTHVRRVSFRIGLTDNFDPKKIEQDLMILYPHEYWGDINYLLIRHGRSVCAARKPLCEECIVRTMCRYFNKYSQKKLVG